MYKPIIYAGHDFAQTITLVDVHPATGVETPVTGGTVNAILATSPSATTAADPTLSVSATHLGSGEWLAHWDNTVLTQAVLDVAFPDGVVYVIFIPSGGQRTYRLAEYQVNRAGVTPLDDLRAALRIRNTAEDEFIQSLYDAALATIERDTGQYYGLPKDVTETVTGWGDVIWLRSTPNSIASIESYEGGEWSPVTDYEQDGRRILITEDVIVWPAERRVTYNTGYAYEDIPADIRQRITQLVTLWFEQRLPSAALLESQNAAIGMVGGI